jgi:hypothetical protein
VQKPCEAVRHEAGTYRGGNALHNLDLLGAVGQTTGTD